MYLSQNILFPDSLPNFCLLSTSIGTVTTDIIYVWTYISLCYLYKCYPESWVFLLYLGTYWYPETSIYRDFVLLNNTYYMLFHIINLYILFNVYRLIHIGVNTYTDNCMYVCSKIQRVKQS